MLLYGIYTTNENDEITWFGNVIYRNQDTAWEYAKELQEKFGNSRGINFRVSTLVLNKEGE